MNATAYVDGSYNSTTKTYGWGVIMGIDDNFDDPIRIAGSDCNPELIQHRNVAGEIMAVFEALKCARTNRVTRLSIYYDYAGIEKWATREWRAKCKFTQWYQNQITIAEEYMYIEFHKVEAHSGDKWNEEADKLAKKACS